MLQTQLKEEVSKIIDSLPPETSREDLIYELYVQEKIERGMQASKEGRVTPVEEMEKRYRNRAS